MLPEPTPQPMTSLRFLATGIAFVIAVHIAWIPSDIISMVIAESKLPPGMRVSWNFPLILPETAALYAITATLAAWFCASRTWAVAGRWACFLFCMPAQFRIVEELLRPSRRLLLVEDEYRNLILTYGIYLPVCLAMAFLGGDLGDWRRRRNEQEQLRAESDEMDSLEQEA